MKSRINLGLAILLWYISSVCVNIAWKKTYAKHKDILGLTSLQFLVSGIISLLLDVLGFGKQVDTRIWFKKLIPVGVTFAIGQLCTNISLSMVSVGLTHVVKTAEPVIAVGAGIFLLGEEFNIKTIIYIAFLLLGVCLTVVHDTQVDWVGISFAALSNFFLQGRNILIKKNQKEMKEEAFYGIPLFCHTVTTGMDVFLILILLYFLVHPSSMPIVAGALTDPSTYIIGICFSCQHLFSYYVLANMSITSHALCNSVKRALIIIISCVVLHTHLFKIQVFGIAMACYFFYLYLGEKKKIGSNTRDIETGHVSLQKSFTRAIRGSFFGIFPFPLFCGAIFGVSYFSGILTGY